MKAFLGKWNTKTIVTMAIGAALYGVLMVYGGIPVFTNTKLSLAMIIAVIVAGICGPVPCMLTAFLGNVIADLIGGWGMWFDWSIGNGVMGLFVGLLPVYGARITDGIFKTRHAIIYAISCVIGCALAFGLVTPVLTYVFYGGELTITFLQSFAASLSNVFMLVVVGIPILFTLTRLNASKSNLVEE